MARERGIYTHLDGAQTFGALALNLRETACDSYSASAHKWFMGPKEAGLLYIRQERIAAIWPMILTQGLIFRRSSQSPSARMMHAAATIDGSMITCP